MDSDILRKWLKAGYIEKGKFHATTVGAAQGGIISPTTLIVTLSGLEKAVKDAVKREDKVNVCVYADDFIITGATVEVLENKVKPVVEAFLSERGLTLHPEKTKITRIDEGFDFLGMNIRKYNTGKLIIKPAKSNIKRFLATIRDTIKSNKTCKTENLIKLLNPKIRGWSNYYRHVCSKQTFSYVDHEIFKAIWSWAVRRHPNKGKRWVQHKYFRNHKIRSWIFSAKTKDKHGNTINVDLVEANKVTIKRHIKIRADATPYDAAYHKYYDKLIAARKIVTGSTTAPSWWLCWWVCLAPRSEKLGSPTAAL